MATILFIFAVLATNLVYVSIKRRSQLQEIMILQEVYDKGMSQTYQEQVEKIKAETTKAFSNAGQTETYEVTVSGIYLLEVYGAQGGKASDIALGFDKNGLGGIVNASRSLMCAYKSELWKDKFKDEEYAKATRAEAIRMRNELNSFLK